MSNLKYFLCLLWIPFVPVIFYKEDVIRFIKSNSSTMNQWEQTNVWKNTLYLRVTKARPTSNAMNTILPQRSPHTISTSKPKFPVPGGNYMFRKGPTSSYYKDYISHIGCYVQNVSDDVNINIIQVYLVELGNASHAFIRKFDNNTCEKDRNQELPLSDQIGKNLSLNITVISAYFRLPAFPKGRKTTMRKSTHYLNWMKSFAWLVNPLIIYTDDQEIFNIMTKLLAEKNRTSSKVILIRREDLWSFKQINEISKIFKQNNYPVHYPNTVIPAYNCLTHAKLELLKLSIENNTFHTKYFIWVDIGYFRYSVARDFGMSMPKNFDERRVGLTYVHALKQNLTLQNVISNNRNYIAGGCFIGRFDVLRTFCNEYLEFVRDAIKQKWIGVEQQMLYAMYSNAKKPKTSLQLCSPGWFCMGRLAVKAWAIEQNEH